MTKAGIEQVSLIIWQIVVFAVLFCVARILFLVKIMSIAVSGSFKKDTYISRGRQPVAI